MEEAEVEEVDEETGGNEEDEDDVTQLESLWPTDSSKIRFRMIL